MVGTPELAPPSPDEATALDPDNRAYQPMSLRGPALAVLGIAVLIVVAGVVASAFGSGTSPNLSIRRITIPDGTVVGLTPATTAMRSIVSAGEPPADILGNLAVPSGSPVTRTLNVDQNAGQFDRTVAFRTGLSSGQVVEVYRALLPRLGWHVNYVGSGSRRLDVGGYYNVALTPGPGDPQARANFLAQVRRAFRREHRPALRNLR